MKRKFTFLIAAAVMLLTMMATTTMWGQSKTTTDVLTLDCATPAPTGSTSTSLDAAGIATFLNSAAGLTNAENKITCSNKTGDVYKGKGSGGENIPQQCLKVGKASGSGGFTFTIPENYDNIDVVEITCYGWKTSSSISINSGTAQTFSTAQVEVTKTFELASSTRTITISVTSSAVCITEIVLKKNDGTSPVIYAANVEIDYDATQGSIEYSIENGSGNVSASVTSGNWLTLGTITATEVPFTCSVNEGNERTATVTLSFTGASNKVVTITQAGNPNAPGTQNNPYTVAQARAAIDAGTGTQGVYATGIVSEIVTAYGTGGYNNVTFNIVDEAGDEVFIQAFRCVGDDAPNVLVGDIAVVTGNLTKYGQTYEFASGCSVVSLEHPSTPYITANDVNITYDATAGSIAYTVENSVQGGQVTAATTSTWLTLGTDFTSPITFTCDANEAGERTATVTLTYTYGAKTTVNKEVTVTQAGNPNVFDNISDITEVGTAYSVKGTVVAINSRGFVMGDGTGYVYYYKNAAPTQAVNDMVTVAGTTGTYGQIIQFTNSATVGEATTSSYNNTPAAEVITAVPDYSTGYHLSTYLEFEGALTKSNSNYFITLGESQIQISYPTTEQGNALTALNGKTVHVKGYFTGINSSSKFTVMLESAVEVAVPSITLNQYTYNLNADGGDAVLPVTYTNMPADPQAEVIFYEANGTTTATYDWITASINASYNIDGHIDTNTGEARTAYFKVKGIDANSNEVYSNLVTINQAAAGATIEFNNTSMTLAAGGESDRQLSFDYSGLGSNPTFSINYYEQDGTTAATYNHDWLTATIEGDKVNISAVANTGEERKAYFKVYGEGNNTNAESNLVTITQSEAPTYAELPFAFNGGKADIEDTDGLSQEGLGSDYSGNNPKLKFDSTDDWVLLQFNERPGTLTFDIKGNSFSGGTFTIQTSVDGVTYTALQAYTELGDTQSVEFGNLAEDVRYIKWIYTNKASGNVGLGNIALAEYAEPVPSISAEDVNIAYDATGGSIAYTINNPVEGGSMSSMPISGGDWLTVGGPSNGSVALTCEQNTGAERTATVRLTYTYNNTKEAVTKDVTVTQAAAPATMYTVNFTLNGGTFVPNDDFTAEIVEIAAGTYTLPSATKAGYDFTGWNDGDQTYAAGDEYTVSADVDFTAQWTESTTTTGTIAFGSASGSTPINSTSVTGDDSLDNEWTITTVFSGETSFTQNANYSQVGASSKPATSITFTMTLPQQKTISAFEAKFGGFSNTAGDINLYVGETNVGSGSLDATNDVTVEANTTTEVGTVLTVTVTNIAKGVKCYYISYTLSDAPVVPVIDATAGSALAYNATTGSIIYEIANYEAGTMTATTTADWINALVVTTPTAEDGEVTFNVTENTSNESRSATVTLSFTYGDPAATVTKDVTVTQNGQPSITVSPATANVTFAGGTPEFTVTYESLSIEDSDDFDVAFYETSTSTTSITKPEWITSAVISGNTTDGFTLTTTVAANDGAARNAYLKVYALDENTEPVYSGLVTISQAEHTQLATYSLVTSVDDIVSGKHYIIASSATNSAAFAMGGQTNNNRSGVAVTIENGQIAETENVYEFVINTHESSSKDVVYTIYDAVAPGYLYASSSSGNQLKTTTNLNDNGRWTIEFSATGEATIIAQGSNTRNVMRYNPNNNNPIFACYASTSTTGNLPCIYVKDNDTDYEYYGTEITYTETSIPDGETITIGTGSVMTVTNNFGNDNPAALVIEDGGQLVFDGTGVKATMKKKTVGESKAEHWYTIASPVNNIDFANITNLTNAATFDLYRYDEATYTWENYKNTAHTDFVTAENGRGYLYYNSDGNELSFAGELNNSASYDLTASGAQMNGLNLIGNPFTQDITLANISLSDDAQISEGFYVLSNNSDWVASVTTVKPCEGFIVKVNKATKATFSKSTGSSKSRANRDYIAFTVANNQYEDVAYAMFSNGLGLDKIDHRNAEIPMVYIPQNGQDYAIATMSDDTEMFNLNFKAMTTGQYTLSVDTKGNYSYLHIYDKMTNEDVDMLLEGEYSFIGSPRDAEDRFVVRLSYRATIDGNDTNIFAYQSGSDIIVSGNGELQVFDVMGRMVATMHVNGVQTMSTSSLQTGLYIFRLNEKTQKIVVR